MCTFKVKTRVLEAITMNIDPSWFLKILGDSQDMVWHILLILEEASHLSPSNHELKILKMEVYSALG